ncbi:MAG: hypothetical protein ACI8RD_013703 [Bacillariaceae sp.]|jgi:hypothetical protein
MVLFFLEVVVVVVVVLVCFHSVQQLNLAASEALASLDDNPNVELMEEHIAAVVGIQKINHSFVFGCPCHNCL